MKRFALFVLGLVLAAPVTAQDKKISELTSGSPPQAGDMIPIARGGANFRLAGSDLLWSPVVAVTTTRLLAADESGLDRPGGAVVCP
jgi:hypothetical protein